MFEKAITRLRHIKSEYGQRPDIKRITDARDSVYERYCPMFSLERIPHLTEAEFQGFLAFENNKHWSGLHRQGSLICQNMDGLRRALLALHKHSQHIEVRWDTARKAANHFGRATLSAALHMSRPSEYGIWNGTSEAGLRQLEIFPNFLRGASEGERYSEINNLLCALSKGLNIDLWELDALMWGLKKHEVEIVLKERVFPHLSPSTREYLLEIYKRDSKEVACLKKTYSHKCQICGSAPFEGMFQNDISEAHHIRWLSRDGVDSRDNMMLLCPNHHTAVHVNDPVFNWETLSFEFTENVVIALKLNEHLKPRSAS